MGSLKSYVRFKKVISEPLDFFYLVDPQGCSCMSPYSNLNNLGYLKIDVVKVNIHQKIDNAVPTICGLLKKTLPIYPPTIFTSLFKYFKGWQIMHSRRIHRNLSFLEEPWHIFLWMKAKKITGGPTIDVPKNYIKDLWGCKV